jgi:hypothetical protein
MGKRLTGRHIVFPAGRQITAHTTKDISPVFGSKAAGYFLMYLGHSDIVFPLIVCERQDRIGHKPEYILFIELKPFQ